MVLTGCPLDRALIQPLALPEQPPAPTNADRLKMWRVMAQDLTRDNHRKRELVGQLDACEGERPRSFKEAVWWGKMAKRLKPELFKGATER